MNIKTEGGKLSISAIATLYQKDRSAVYRLVKARSLSTEKTQFPPRTLISLTDIVQHWGEPSKSATPNATSNDMSMPHDDTSHVTPDKYVALLEKNNEELKSALAEEKSEKRELKKQINELYLEFQRVNRLLLEDTRKGFWKRLFT